MPSHDQLEIIDARGEIRFHPLTSGSGITNIGRHPDNDIVIDSPDVAPFHAILDHQHKPYRLIALHPDSKIKVSGQVLQPNTPKELHNWDTVELDGCSIILMEGGAPGVIAAPSITPAPLPTPLPAIPQTDAMRDAQIAPVSTDFPDLDALDQLLASIPEDRVDEVIVVEPTAQNGAIDPTHPNALDFAVEVEQPATMQVTIVNAGDLVGEFNVEVRGVDPAWVAIAPRMINLNEGERGNVTIALTAPRLSGSRAKAYYFAVVVTSPNYPDRLSSTTGMFVVKPFYEYAVGDIDPKKQKISYSRRAGQSAIPITNLGNSVAGFQLTGEDERHAATIEFDTPEEGVKLVGQVQVHIPPEQTTRVPIYLTPRKRKLLGVGSESIHYTVNVAPLEGEQRTPRTVLAEAQCSPLIGPLPIILLLLLLLALGVFTFTPRIDEFKAEKVAAAAGPSEKVNLLIRSDENAPLAIASGEKINLSWRAWPFVSLRLETYTQGSSGEDVLANTTKVEGPESSLTFSPLKNTKYVLTGETFLTLLVPQWFKATKEVRVLVDPIFPEIVQFEANDPEIDTGSSVTVAWEVINAEEVVLSINGEEETIPAEQYRASRTLKLTQDTIFTLIAKNQFKPEGETKSVTVRAVTPSPTPPPTPGILEFNVLPVEITAGESVTISWSVTNVSKVTISGVQGELPPSGTVRVQPANTTKYVLMAGDKPIGEREVTVRPPPTGTPQPQPPKIEYFLATPAEVGVGTTESKNIQLSWSITGDMTRAEITGPNGAKYSGLPRQGTLKVSTDKPTLYVLTAFNGSLSVSQTAKIGVKNPTPKITSINPSSSTSVGGAGFALTVNGTGFVKDSKVQWAGSNRSTAYVNETELTATILPEDLTTAGTFEVKVFNPSPGGGTSGSATFTLNNPVPSLTGLSPASLTKGSPGITLTASGSNFVQGSVVRFNGVDAPTTYISSSQLTAQLTASQLVNAGTPAVVVFNPTPGGGTSGALTFTINPSNPVPTINSLTAPTPGLQPSSAPAGSSQFTITVNGSNYISGSLVRWKGTFLTTTYISDTQLQATVPTAKLAASGPVKITVYNPAPGGGTSNAVDFTITGPTVDLDSPDMASPYSVQQSTTDGLRMRVTISAAQAAMTTVSLSSNNPSLLTIHSIDTDGDCAPVGAVRSSIDIVPPATSANFCVKGVSPGSPTVTAVLPSSLGSDTDVETVTVFGTAPVISSIDVAANLEGTPPTSTIAPTADSIGVGSPSFALTITGGGFTANAKVGWSGQANLTPSSNTGSVITVTVPQSYVLNVLTGGSAPQITVINNPSGTPISSNAVSFNINAPTLTSITEPTPPPPTKVAGDAQFTLRVDGANFVSNSKIRWNGADITATTNFVDSTELYILVPASYIQTDGLATITVTNPSGTGSPTTNPATLTITLPTLSLTPALTSPSWTAVQIGSSTPLTISINPAQSVSRSVKLTTSNSTISLKASSNCSGPGITPLTPVAITSTLNIYVCGNSVTGSAVTVTAEMTIGSSTVFSPPSDFMVTQAATSTTVVKTTPTSNPVTGELITFTATVTSGGGTPTGSVDFTDSLQGLLCDDAPLSSGIATCTVALNALGAVSRTITASYNVTTNFATSSGTLTLTVNKADTNVTLSMSATTSVYGEAVTFNAAIDVQAPGGGAPSSASTVELVNNGTTTLDSSPVGANPDQVNITPATSLNAGSYSLTAAYLGDTNYNSATSAPAQTHTVTPANTSTSVTSDEPDNVTAYGETVIFTATVTNTSATGPSPVGVINFTANSSTITGCGAVALAASGANTSTATCPVDTELNASLAAYSITATYTPSSVPATNFNASSDSTPLLHTIQKANTTITITSDAPDPSLVNQAYTVNFTLVADAPSTVNPSSGTITISDGSVSCNAVLPATSCSLTSTTWGNPKTLTATFPADTNYNTDSDTESHTVNPEVQLSVPSPATIQVGGGADSASESQFTVTLTGGAQTGVRTINLTASNGSLGFTNCTTTTSITSVATVAPNFNTATFCAVGISAGSATVTATLATLGNDSDTSAAITVNNPTISFTAGPTPSTIDVDGSGGSSTTASLTITITAAQTSNTTITLAASNGAITVPATVTILAGSTTVTFNATAASPGSATVTGTLPAGLGSGSTGASGTITVVA